MIARRSLLLAIGLTLLAACSSTPPAPPVPAFDARAAVAAIRATGGAASSELDVQPLRDTQAEDLREDAQRLEREGKVPEAATALDQALAITPDDPALLQERAEASLLLQQPDSAEQFARRAIALGAQVGPLCRRHWETVAQATQMRGHYAQAAGRGEEAAAQAAAEASARKTTIDQARQKRDACTVAAPPRY
ncbi:putative Zn-dependent protease [Lysobacter niastensis]|uniref:Zn-dependent protease n=1 Tax=Lysobacter niastensis TaxID=380629 RepID=A0ABU1WBU9_9GAMM|nr:tetratricopeptide repeat protein [Lysobacter niastensis]MDR7134956.1 putative Zn-dependent protease [Lysobacter niastensis]